MQGYEKVEKIGEGRLTQREKRSLYAVIFLSSLTIFSRRHLRNCVQSQGQRIRRNCGLESSEVR